MVLSALGTNLNQTAKARTVPGQVTLHKRKSDQKLHKTKEQTKTVAQKWMKLLHHKDVGQ